jgi:hypothetical protein
VTAGVPRFIKIFATTQGFVQVTDEHRERVGIAAEPVADFPY